MSLIHYLCDRFPAYQKQFIWLGYMLLFFGGVFWFSTFPLLAITLFLFDCSPADLIRYNLNLPPPLMVLTAVINALCLPILYLCVGDLRKLRKEYYSVSDNCGRRKESQIKKNTISLFGWGLILTLVPFLIGDLISGASGAFFALSINPPLDTEGTGLVDAVVVCLMFTNFGFCFLFCVIIQFLISLVFRNAIQIRTPSATAVSSELNPR